MFNVTNCGADQSSGFPNPEPETLLMAVATPRLVTLNTSANRPTVPPRPGNGNVLSARTSSPVDAGSRRLPRGSARTSPDQGDEELALPRVTAVELVDAAQAQAAEPRERIRPEQLDRVREVQGHSSVPVDQSVRVGVIAGDTGVSPVGLGHIAHVASRLRPRVRGLHLPAIRERLPDDELQAVVMAARVVGVHEELAAPGDVLL